MLQSNHQFEHNLPLRKLSTEALGQLEKLGYSARSLRRYRTIWQHLIAFSQQKDLGDTFSENLAGCFIDAYRIRDGEIVDPKDGWRRHVDFGIKLLANFASQGRLNRTRTDMQKVHIPPAMRKPLRDFEEYCRDRRHLRPTTLSERIREIAIFLGFLGS